MSLLGTVGALGTQAYNAGSIYSTLHLIDQPFYEGLSRVNRSAAIMATEVNKSFNTASVGAERLANSLLAIGFIASMGVGAAVYAYLNFEQQMRNVNSITGLSEIALQGLTQEVLNLSQELGNIHPEDLAKGMYQLASAGKYGSEALIILKQSAILASAGMGNVEDSVKAVTGVMNAYGLSVKDSQETVDTIFKMVNYGIVTVDQATQGLGEVVGTAAQAGVSLKDVAAAIATITKTGIQPAEAFTALNNLLMGFLKPTKELQDLLHNTFGMNGEEFLKENGLYGAMIKIRKEVGSGAEALKNYFSNIRQLRAGYALSQQNGLLFGQMNALINTGAPGAAEAARKEQMNSQKTSVEKLTVAFNNLGISVGKAYAPSFNIIVKSVTELINKHNIAIVGFSKYLITISLVGGGLLKLTNITRNFIASKVAEIQVMKLGMITNSLSYSAERRAKLSNVTNNSLLIQSERELSLVKSRALLVTFQENQAALASNVIYQENIVLAKGVISDKLRLIDLQLVEIATVKKKIAVELEERAERLISVHLRGAALTSHTGLTQKLIVQNNLLIQSELEVTAVKAGLTLAYNTETRAAGELINVETLESIKLAALTDQKVAAALITYEMAAAMEANKLASLELLNATVGLNVVQTENLVLEKARVQAEIISAGATRVAAQADLTKVISTTALTVSTTGLNSALSALWVLIGGPLGLAIIGLSILIPVLTSAYEKHKQKIEELHNEKIQEAVDAENAALTRAAEIDSLSNLVIQYTALNLIKKRSAEEETTFTKTGREMRKKLVELTGDQRNYGLSIEATTKKLKELITMQAIAATTLQYAGARASFNKTIDNQMFTYSFLTVPELIDKLNLPKSVQSKLVYPHQKSAGSIFLNPPNIFNTDMRQFMEANRGILAPYIAPNSAAGLKQIDKDAKATVTAMVSALTNSGKVVKSQGITGGTGNAKAKTAGTQTKTDPFEAIKETQSNAQSSIDLLILQGNYEDAEKIRTSLINSYLSAAQRAEKSKTPLTIHSNAITTEGMAFISSAIAATIAQNTAISDRKVQDVAAINYQNRNEPVTAASLQADYLGQLDLKNSYKDRYTGASESLKYDAGYIELTKNADSALDKYTEFGGNNLKSLAQAALDKVKAFSTIISVYFKAYVANLAEQKKIKDSQLELEFDMSVNLTEKLKITDEQSAIAQKNLELQKEGTQGYIDQQRVVWNLAGRRAEITKAIVDQKQEELDLVKETALKLEEKANKLIDDNVDALLKTNVPPENYDKMTPSEQLVNLSTRTQVNISAMDALKIKQQSLGEEAVKNATAQILEMLQANKLLAVEAEVIKQGTKDIILESVKGFGTALWDSSRDKSAIKNYFNTAFQNNSSKIFEAIWKNLTTGRKMDTGNPAVDNLFSSKGIGNLFYRTKPDGTFEPSKFSNYLNAGSLIAGSAQNLGKGGVLGGLSSGFSLGTGVTSALTTSGVSMAGGLGMGLLGGFAILGAAFGWYEEQKRARKLANDLRKQQLEELKKLNSAISPVSDFYRSMNLDLLPTSGNYVERNSNRNVNNLADSYAVITSRGVR